MHKDDYQKNSELILDSQYQRSLRSTDKFEHKRVLFIGSESYDAPTITLIQGLSSLGFEIHTIRKQNINSFFVAKVITEPDPQSYDFVLSNLHWGTRWSLYSEYGLHACLKVLVDGDDNHREHNWQQKIERYKRRYVCAPPDEIKDMQLAPYRWLEDCGNYKPDIVFECQKMNGNGTIYLPFGIHQEYLDLDERLNWKERDIDIAHIPGPGIWRKITKVVLRAGSATSLLKQYRIFNEPVYGDILTPQPISDYISRDANVHSYHRWSVSLNYFRVLNRSRLLVYPNISRFPFWDSKRPWEAYAVGCAVLMKRPCIDTSRYPPEGIESTLVYKDERHLLGALKQLFRDEEKCRVICERAVARARKYFSARAIARYFLMQVYEQYQAS